MNRPKKSQTSKPYTSVQYSSGVVEYNSGATSYGPKSYTSTQKAKTPNPFISSWSFWRSSNSSFDSNLLRSMDEKFEELDNIDESLWGKTNDLESQIDELKRENENLKDKIADLESKIDELVKK